MKEESANVRRLRRIFNLMGVNGWPMLKSLREVRHALYIPIHQEERTGRTPSDIAAAEALAVYDRLPKETRRMIEACEDANELWYDELWLRHFSMIQMHNAACEVLGEDNPLREPIRAALNYLGEIPHPDALEKGERALAELPKDVQHEIRRRWRRALRDSCDEAVVNGGYR